jgi:hypothetical protein
MPRGLKLLQIMYCDLNVQRFVNFLGSNLCPPKMIQICACADQTLQEPYAEFSSIIVPLLKNPRTESLCLLSMGSRGINIATIKEALEFNQGLELLSINGCLEELYSMEFKELFHGIASAPKLRWFDLQVEGAAMSVSSLKLCEMFAQALRDCKNTTLETDCKICTSLYGSGSDDLAKDYWSREVKPILEFNCKRRIFQANSSGLPKDAHLINALMLAEVSANDHFRFWLVRNYICNYLTWGVGKPEIVETDTKGTDDETQVGSSTEPFTGSENAKIDEQNNELADVPPKVTTCSKATEITSEGDSNQGKLPPREGNRYKTVSRRSSRDRQGQWESIKRLQS